MIKLLLTNSDGTQDITQLVESITWAGDIMQCARTLDFQFLSSPTDKNIPVIKCELGNTVQLKHNDMDLFEGVVFDRQKGTENSLISIGCCDFGIYLKRNEGTYKFTNMTPEAITKRVCADFGIEVGSLPATNVKISRNFIGVSLYQIIQTAYTLAADRTGKKYMIRFKGRRLNVIEKGITDETVVIEAGSNLMSASVSESISGMVNQVTIYDKNDKLVATQSNSEAIKLYGLMQSYLRVTEGVDAIARAKKILEDNGVSQKITVNNLGNIANIAGNTVVVREPHTGLYGLFYIDADAHTWKRGQYYNKLVLNFRNIMDEQEVGLLPNKSGDQTSGEKWQYLYKPGTRR